VVDEIRDGHETGALDDAERTVLAWTDAFLSCADPDRELRAAMDTHFDGPQQVELTAGIALFMGFSKIAIALGGVPDDMPVMKTSMPGSDAE
jgi:alkylhydroperoxidase family enzyme